MRTNLPLSSLDVAGNLRTASNTVRDSRPLCEGRRIPGSTCAPALDWLSGIENRLVIAASASSRHAGLFAEPVIEDFSGIAVDVEYASEYCYRSVFDGHRGDGRIPIWRDGRYA